VASVTIKIDGLGRLMEGIAGDITKKVDRALYDAAQRGRKLLIERTPLGVSSQMRQAWSAPEKNALGYLVHNDAPHAAIVEFGSRPHMPPVAPLILWVMRVIGPRLKDEMKTVKARGIKLTKKGGTWESTGKGEPATARGALEKAATEIAWLIAWKIKARGTRAQNIAGGAEPELRRIVEEELARALAGM
jgi:hypothetical protein